MRGTRRQFPVPKCEAMFCINRKQRLQSTILNQLMRKHDGSSPLARNNSHHQSCHIPGAMRTVLMGRSSQHLLFHPTSLLMLPIIWDQGWEQWPVSMGIVPAQSDGVTLCPPGRGGDARQSVLSCPSHLSPGPKGAWALPFTWHSPGNVGPGATGMALFGDICCLCHQGEQHRAGLVLDLGGCEGCLDPEGRVGTSAAWRATRHRCDLKRETLSRSACGEA